MQPVHPIKSQESKQAVAVRFCMHVSAYSNNLMESLEHNGSVRQNLFVSEAAQDAVSAFQIQLAA